jgi:hypothetical protein
MSKIYHYLYTINDLKDDHRALLNLNAEDSPEPDDDDWQDVIAYLDRHSFDVSQPVVQRLLEYARDQLRGR